MKKLNTVHIEQLPYLEDGCLWYERLQHLDRPLFFDSCHPFSSQGRFDILMADPIEYFDYSSSNTTGYDDLCKLFTELGERHGSYCRDLVGHSESLPFCGGLAGCLDYGLGKPLQFLDAEPGVKARMGFYGWAIVQDHLRGQATLAILPCLDAARRRRLDELLGTDIGSDQQRPFKLLDAFEVDLDMARYAAAFESIQRYIHAGDCYQVNLARRFSAPFEGDPWVAYKQLRGLAASPFSAYFDSGDRQHLCLSPERFLRLAGKHVETRPIKGTRRRHTDPVEDVAAAEALKASEKDRAENLMIVDLLRNDIGRNCAPGTVQAERLFELESYPTVHHLVSTITGEFAEGTQPLDVLRDCFPGGSITGAPKRRAMEIIEELETAPREAYCGSFFYLGSDGRLDSNIAIRTLLAEKGVMKCWGGGGIVADSDCELEFRETWDKVGRFIESLESALPGRAQALAAAR